MAAHLLTGDDESLVRAAASDVVHQLVGDEDRAFAVVEFDADDYDLAAVVDAAQTPPFLTERRVVVARDVGRFTADQVAPLISVVTDLLPTTELVLVSGGGRVREGSHRRHQVDRRDRDEHHGADAALGSGRHGSPTGPRSRGSG